MVLKQEKYPHPPETLFLCILLCFFNGWSVIIWCGTYVDIGITLEIEDAKPLAVKEKEMFNTRRPKKQPSHS